MPKYRTHSVCLAVGVALVLGACKAADSKAKGPAAVSAPRLSPEQVAGLLEDATVPILASRSPVEVARTVDPPAPGRDHAPSGPGPGLIVFDPVTPDASPNRSFAVGCARWLQLALGGDPAFSRSPAWKSLDRVRMRLNRPDLALSAEQAAALAKPLGSTHVAVAELRDGPPINLAFQLYSVPGLRKVGEPVRAEGDEAALAGALPRLAQEIAGILRTKPVSALLPAPGPTALKAVGNSVWMMPLFAAPVQPRELKTEAERDPLAATVYVSNLGSREPTDLEKASRFLIKSLPGNGIVTTEIAWAAPKVIQENAQTIRANARRHPDSYLFALSEVSLRGIEQKPKEARLAAERLVKLSPQNSQSWLVLAATLYDETNAVRKGRFFPMLSPAEAAFVSGVYPRIKQLAERATKVDPDHGRAWLKLSSAAAFAGDEQTADLAFWKAHKLLPVEPDVYQWGLDLYQEKWLGHAENLNKVAGLATAAQYAFPSQAVDVGVKLLSAGFAEESARLLDRTVGELQKRVAADSNDWQSFHALGKAFQARNNTLAAESAYLNAIKAAPDNASLHFEYARTQHLQRRLVKAEEHYRTALKLEPTNPLYHYSVGYICVDLDKREEAEKELRLALRMNPDLKDGNETLARLYMAMGRFAEAAEHYERGIPLMPLRARSYVTLCELYMRLKKPDGALATARTLLGVYPREFVSHNLMSAVLGYQKQYQRALEHADIALQLSPQNPFAHLNRGSALIGLGNREVGRKELEMVVKMDNGKYAAEARRRLERLP